MGLEATSPVQCRYNGGGTQGLTTTMSTFLTRDGIRQGNGGEKRSPKAGLLKILGVRSKSTHPRRSPLNPPQRSSPIPRGGGAGPSSLGRLRRQTSNTSLTQTTRGFVSATRILIGWRVLNAANKERGKHLREQAGANTYIGIRAGIGSGFDGGWSKLLPPPPGGRSPTPNPKRVFNLACQPCRE